MASVCPYFDFSDSKDVSGHCSAGRYRTFSIDDTRTVSEYCASDSDIVEEPWRDCIIYQEEIRRSGVHHNTPEEAREAYRAAMGGSIKLKDAIKSIIILLLIGVAVSVMQTIGLETIVMVAGIVLIIVGVLALLAFIKSFAVSVKRSRAKGTTFFAHVVTLYWEYLIAALVVFILCGVLSGVGFPNLGLCLVGIGLILIGKSNDTGIKDIFKLFDFSSLKKKDDAAATAVRQSEVAVLHNPVEAEKATDAIAEEEARRDTVEKVSVTRVKHRIRGRVVLSLIIMIAAIAGAFLLKIAVPTVARFARFVLFGGACAEFLIALTICFTVFRNTRIDGKSLLGALIVAILSLWLFMVPALAEVVLAVTVFS